MIQDNIGIPSDSIDSIIDFIDQIATALITTMFLPFLEKVWGAFVFTFITVAPTIGFLLMIAIFLYMFNQKYIAEG
ncbi:MAG: hypothetical protein ACXACR_02480 [Candidatus Hodarchaeales archaeon]|jgi:hypothetical protein